MATKELTRQENTHSSAAEPGASTVKSILVHIQDSESATDRVEAALAIARATSAHITCLHVTAVEAFVAFDGLGGVFVMNDVMEAIDKEAVRLRGQIEDELQGEDVTWDYVHKTGHVAGEVVAFGALADVIVTGREPRRNDLGIPTITFLGDLLKEARTPLFIPGSGVPDPTGPAIIAWDGSFEAANAVRASLGLLKLASSVTVMMVSGQPEKKNAFPGTRLLEYLSRHGIHAELVVHSTEGAEDDFVAAAILSRARATGSCVIMGGYGHSRVREYLFGGVTRTMLSEADVPVVIAR